MPISKVRLFSKTSQLFTLQTKPHRYLQSYKHLHFLNILPLLGAEGMNNNEKDDFSDNLTYICPQFLSYSLLHLEIN